MNKQGMQWYRNWERRLSAVLMAAVLVAGMAFAGCGNAESVNGESNKRNNNGDNAAGNPGEASAGAITGKGSGQGAAGEVTLLDVSDMFSSRDREIGYDESGCVRIELQGDTAQSDSSGVQIEGNVVTITEEGSYLLTGNLQGRLAIAAEKTDKLQLILDGASISCAGSAALYVSQADKVFVTTAAGSENLLETIGEYAAIDEHNIDGAVYARDDITLNGEGLLRVKSEAGNGIVGKDDLVVTSGVYEITAGKHGLEGKDSVRIANGDIVINAGQDGVHSGNDEDETAGYTYIAGGSLTITAGDDGIHSDTELVVGGGCINVVESYEGLEGSSIEIAGGIINVRSGDDGLNAAGGNDGSGMQSPFGKEAFAGDAGHVILISGGSITVNADGDGIDSNGNLYVYGGEVLVHGPSNGANGALDYNGEASISGGTVIALGASQMAENFGQGSSQCSIMVNLQAQQGAGTAVELQDASGEILLSCVTLKSCNCVVLSCGEIKVGETYTVRVGEETIQVEMTEIIYGSGGFGHGGGFKPGREGLGDRPDRPEGFGGKTDRPEGFRPGDRNQDGQKPDM